MIILHVGLHKTGTTTLQHDILPNGRGYVYGGREYRDHGLIDRGIGADTLVLSDETLLGRLFDSFFGRNTRPWVDENVARIAWLGRHLPDSRIILSVRRTDHWLLSIYKHHLRYGGTTTLPDFLARLDQPGFLGWQDLHLIPRLRALEQSFPGRMLVLFMEEIAQELPRLLAELGTFISGDPTCFSRVADLPRRNEGVNRSSAAVLRRLNSLPGLRGVGDLRDSRLRIRLMRRMGLTPATIANVLTCAAPSSPLSWSPEQRELIRRKCGDDLRHATDWIRDHRPATATPFLERLLEDF